MKKQFTNTYDFDGVCYISKDVPCGVNPLLGDLIITGRSFEEESVTFKQMDELGIDQGIEVVFNPLPFDQKTRETSGQHKGRIIKALIEMGFDHGYHFEDDEVQIQEILKIVPDCRIIHMKHTFTEKENIRHEE